MLLEIILTCWRLKYGVLRGGRKWMPLSVDTTSEALKYVFTDKCRLKYHNRPSTCLLSYHHQYEVN